MCPTFSKGLAVLFFLGGGETVVYCLADPLARMMEALTTQRLIELLLTFTYPATQYKEQLTTETLCCSTVFVGTQSYHQSTWERGHRSPLYLLLTLQQSKMRQM